MKLALKVTGLSSPVMECRIDHGLFTLLSEP